MSRQICGSIDDRVVFEKETHRMLWSRTKRMGPSLDLVLKEGLSELAAFEMRLEG